MIDSGERADAGPPEATRVTDAEVRAFEDRLEEAVRSGSAEGLDIVGYGEVSIALKMATPRGDFVCKRLVPFASKTKAEDAAALIGLYIERLGACGIDVVETEVSMLERPAGHVLYCIQPMLDPRTLGPDFMRGMGPDEAAPYMTRIFEHLRASVSPTLAPDGQLSNWVIDGEQLRYLDVGTPFMRDESGTTLFDFRQQTQAIPQPIRAVVNRFMLKGILDNYHSARGQALDFLGNLIKEGLGQLLVPMIPVANQVFEFSSPISEGEVRAHYKSDAQSYALIQSVRRADRWLHQHILHKPYPHLLPPRIQRF